MDNRDFVDYFEKKNNLRVLFRDELSSTNDLAKREAALTPDTDVLVAAKRQSAGRGRLGRTFSSEPGGLYLSLSHRPVAPANDCLHFAPLAALAVSDAILDLTGVMCGVKWPNDLLIDDRKVCGILVEAIHSGASFFLVTGVGINVSNPVPPDVNAARLADYARRLPALGELAARVADKLREYYAAAIERKAELLELYRSRCVTIGREIRSKSDGSLVGTAVGIDENAALLIRTADGRVITKTAGEI